MRSVLLVAALAALSVPVYAQVPVEEEAWVRLHVNSGQWIHGEVSAIAPGAIVLLLRNGTDSIIPLTEIRRADVRVSQRRGGKKGFGITLLGVSAALGVATAITYDPDDQCLDCWFTLAGRGEEVVFVVLVGGVMIALPAATAVALIKFSKWERGLLPDLAAPTTDPRRTSPLASASLQIAPAGGRGLSVGLSVPIGGRR